jgi:hypothetical protein
MGNEPVSATRASSGAGGLAASPGQGPVPAEQDLREAFRGLLAGSVPLQLTLPAGHIAGRESACAAIAPAVDQRSAGGQVAASPHFRVRLGSIRCHPSASIMATASSPRAREAARRPTSSMSWGSGSGRVSMRTIPPRLRIPVDVLAATQPRS